MSKVILSGVLVCLLVLSGRNASAVQGDQAIATVTQPVMTETIEAEPTRTPTASVTVPAALLLSLTALSVPSLTLTPTVTATFPVTSLPDLSATATADAGHVGYTQPELSAALGAFSVRQVALIGCDPQSASDFDIQVEAAVGLLLKRLKVSFVVYDGTDETARLKHALDAGSGGMLVCNNGTDGTAAFQQALSVPLRYGIPVIVYGGGETPPGVVSVGNDQFEVGHTAGDFAAQGVIAMNRIGDGAIVVSDSTSIFQRDRLDGLKRAFDDKGMNSDVFLRYAGKPGLWAATLKKAISEHPHASVVVCLADGCEMPAYEAIKASGVSADRMWVIAVGGGADVRNAMREGKWFAGYVNRGLDATAVAVVQMLVHRAALTPGLSSHVSVYSGAMVTLGNLPGNPQVLEPTETMLPSPTSGATGDAAR